MKELKTIWGKKLDLKDKKKRLKNYLLESLIFAGIMAVLDVLAIFATKNKSVFFFVDNYAINFIITVIITTVLLFLLAFLIDYLVCEKNIKKIK
ncbi:MAG TPA: hypothetical protein PLX66_00425 [Bacilli bacterium]|nr:hypothetical protein [Bacilli bacterium]